MCMENPKMIPSDKVPKHGWKVLEREYGNFEEYTTPFFNQTIEAGEWTKATSLKRDDDDVHHGRMTLFALKKDAKAFRKLLNNSGTLHKNETSYVVRKVNTKQTTDFAYRGDLSFFEEREDDGLNIRWCKTYAVDQIKTIEE